MKKLLLMSAVAGLAAIDASAQLAPGSTMMRKEVPVASKLEIGHTGGVISTTGTPTGKTTVGGSRWYSYADYCFKLDPDFTNNGSLPYLWNKGDGMGIYSDGSGGLIADTIQYASYGISFDPAFSFKAGATPTTVPAMTGFNEPSVYPGNSVVVTRSNAYTIDSVMIFGAYGRNVDRTSITDTLRVSVVYGGAASGSDMPVYYYSGMAASFGSDTVRFAALQHDTVKNIAKGTTLMVKDLLLTPTSLFDTAEGGLNAFKVAIGMNVPAGNVVGVAVTFISGDTYVPYKDTIFYGSARPANPFGRGMFRPSVFEEKAGGFPNYYSGYYNVGFAKFLPERGTYGGLYVPSYAYTAPFTLEVPNVDVKVSCATCLTIDEWKKVSIKESSVLADVQAFPNPANTELSVPFTVKEKANVTVSISNMVGQVVATQNMGNLNAGQKATATFSTSTLAAGVYLYTVEANGQRITNRFTVAH